jgi:hypothetical protein
MGGSIARRGSVGLALLVAAATASAQESVIFSTTSAATAGFGPLEDTEIALYDASAGITRPWLMAPTGAFFTGDVTGDGATDLWKDVDALYVGQVKKRVVDVIVSFNTGLGGFVDGDLIRLDPAGVLSMFHSESELVIAFAIGDGNVDVDGLHVGPDGRIYVSFADNEASSLVSTDLPGTITDGSIVWWDPVNLAVGVQQTETAIDGLVSHAMGKAVTTGDTLGIAMDRNGVICFSVQNPSTDDASVFSEANGGEYVRKEADLGLTGAPEIDALDLTPFPPAFLAARATPRLVPGNISAVVDLDTAPSVRPFVLLLSTARGDADLLPFKGMRGVALDALDPLFAASLHDLPWCLGVTDVAGHASVTLPPAPVGVVMTLFCQPFDLGSNTVGTPIALELQG